MADITSIVRRRQDVKTATTILAAAFLASGLAVAHEKAPLAKKAAKAPISTEEKAFGREGDPKKVNRTIKVDMSDAMRFAPAEIAVKRGETIRFEVKNSGTTMHEMVIGTMQELKEHAELMKKHPGMEHDEAYMAHVAPGKTERILWQFTKPGEFYYGCLLPGHFEAGMIGKVIVK
jgi:uncharacterized cupredoxin-like copper-binding protein